MTVEKSFTADELASCARAASDSVRLVAASDDDDDALSLLASAFASDGCAAAARA
ncbi:hypothetical protein V1282_003013 [Nitrobacteraceae bacterium AZCC 2146]